MAPPTNAIKINGAALLFINAFFQAPIAAIPATPVPNTDPHCR